MKIFKEIPFDLTPEKVSKSMKSRNSDQTLRGIVEELIEVANEIGNPRAVYKVAFIDEKREDAVTIEGVTFTSSVLRGNLDEVERVFPYVATCGVEMEDYVLPSQEYIKSFCWDAIKTLVLRQAINYLTSHVKETYALGDMSHMNPGSLESWPITEQPKLFSLFGDVEELIGVKLTDSHLMRPLKSVSGIFFPTEIRFESCQLCPREKCIGRRAAFDAVLARKYKIEVS